MVNCNPHTLTTVPNQPRTPHRTFRIPDVEYDAAKEKAESEGTTLTAVVREKLREYVEGAADRSVVAARENGDNPSWDHVQIGDVISYQVIQDPVEPEYITTDKRIYRIERQSRKERDDE